MTNASTKKVALTMFLVAAVVPMSLAVTHEPLASIPNPRLRDGTWVVDLAGALQRDTVTRLNQTIGATAARNNVEMAVVVIRSLDGLSIEEAAAKLFKMWGIGDKQRDTGLLLLWSTGDRRVKVEVGYGLEGALPDSKVGAILEEYVIPRFQSNEFDAGIVAGVDALLAAARSESVPLPAAASASYDRDGDRLPWFFWLSLFGSLPAGLALWSATAKRRRYRRRRCPQCRAAMRLVPESEDDSLLESGQAKEEQLGSVDYDVWQCPACSHQFTLRYPKPGRKFGKCPQCGNYTKSSTMQIIPGPTPEVSGSVRHVEQCAFCTFTNEYTRQLGQRKDSDSDSSPSIRYESPHSGDNGSSSSRDSSSFGGGRSGGGGASRGY